MTNASTPTVTSAGLDNGNAEPPEDADPRRTSMSAASSNSRGMAIRNGLRIRPSSGAEHRLGERDAPKRLSIWRSRVTRMNRGMIPTTRPGNTARNEDHEQRLTHPELVARRRVGGHHAEQHGDHRGDESDDGRVECVAPEVGVGHHVAVVGPHPWVREAPDGSRRAARCCGTRRAHRRPPDRGWTDHGDQGEQVDQRVHDRTAWCVPASSAPLLLSSSFDRAVHGAVRTPGRAAPSRSRRRTRSPRRRRRFRSCAYRCPS